MWKKNNEGISVVFKGMKLCRLNYERFDDTDSLRFSPYSVTQLLLLICSRVKSVCRNDSFISDLQRNVSFWWIPTFYVWSFLQDDWTSEANNEKIHKKITHYSRKNEDSGKIRSEKIFDFFEQKKKVFSVSKMKTLNRVKRYDKLKLLHEIIKLFNAFIDACSMFVINYTLD